MSLTDYYSKHYPPVTVKANTSGTYNGADNSVRSDGLRPRKETLSRSNMEHPYRPSFQSSQTRPYHPRRLPSLHPYEANEIAESQNGQQAGQPDKSGYKDYMQRLFISGITFFVITLNLYALQTVYIQDIQFQINTTKKQIRQAILQNDALKMQVSRNLSLQRIEQLARENFAMESLSEHDHRNKIIQIMLPEDSQTQSSETPTTHLFY